MDLILEQYLVPQLLNDAASTMPVTRQHASNGISPWSFCTGPKMRAREKKPAFFGTGFSGGSPGSMTFSCALLSAAYGDGTEYGACGMAMIAIGKGRMLKSHRHDVLSGTDIISEIEGSVETDTKSKGHSRCRCVTPYQLVSGSPAHARHELDKSLIIPNVSGHDCKTESS